MRILLAGATGVIGREIAAALSGAGHELRTISRSAGFDALRPETLAGCCDGIDIAVSAMGGSVSLGAPERRPYAVTNTEANRNLLNEANRAGVRRFVYIAAHAEPGYAHTAYIRSHEAVVAALAASGIAHTVLRPTAIFDALAPFVAFAQRGFVPIIGNGFANTNPISARDVARAALQFLQEGPISVSIGGPDVLSRRRIAELAAGANRPWHLSAPPAIARMNGRIAGLFHPRLGELIEFAAAVSVQDCIAPIYGQDRLSDYFATLATAARKSSIGIPPG